MKTRRYRLLSLVLALLVVISMLTVGVAATLSVSAATGDTVFCQNDAGWGEVYCYMWTDGGGENAGWPGVKMTEGDNNLWSYTVTGDWNKIIFNIGSSQNQTQNMDYQGHGSCYNNSTQQWTTLEVEENTTPVETPTTPSVTTPTPSDSYVVYCLNSAGWSSVSVYMWNSGSGNNAGWPGKSATHIGDDVWMLEYDKSYQNIIFSSNGNNQTGDLTHPGTGYMYNNKTGEWTFYDPSQLHITSTTASVDSPQYTGVEILLSVVAGGGEGELSYKITVNNTVLSDYSADNTVLWTPAEAGTYTITFSVKDSEGNTKEQTMSYTVKDISAEVKPVVQSVSVTPTNSENNELKKGTEATIDVTAGGGNTGTKLLFYKVKITDPSGQICNVPYYTTSDTYKFTPTELGTYEISVSVQSSDNSTVTRTYEYECVNELSAPGVLKASAQVTGGQTIGSTASITASASGGVAPYTYQFKVNSQVVKAYSSTATYSLGLSAEGNYTVEISVKDSEGTVATKTLIITVAEDSTDDPVIPPTTKNPDSDNPDDPDATARPEESGYLKGDADCSGAVNVKDVTAIQKHVADIEFLSEEGKVNADVDENETINIKDATSIQKWIAGLLSW